MSFIEIVNEDSATGTVKDDYAFIASSYSHMAQDRRCPRLRCIAPAAWSPHTSASARYRIRVLTNDGTHDRPMGALPGIMVNFAVSLHSACYY